MKKTKKITRLILRTLTMQETDCLVRRSKTYFRKVVLHQNERRTIKITERFEP